MLLKGVEREAVVVEGEDKEVVEVRRDEKIKEATSQNVHLEKCQVCHL